MRNQILWTEKLDEATQQEEFVLIDVSRLISERFETEKEGIFADPTVTIQRILNSVISSGTKRIIFANVGLLLEPVLHISVEKLFLSYAVSYTVVIFWPFAIHNGRRMVWDADQSEICLEFSENTLQHLELKV